MNLVFSQKAISIKKGYNLYAVRVIARFKNEVTHLHTYPDFPRVTDPKASTLLQIASYFGITIEQLMGLESIIPQGQPRELISSQQVPIFEISNYGDQQAPKEWYRWSENTIDGDYYALSVDTDLYEPTFPLNSLLIINPDLKPEDRSFVVIRTKNKSSHCSIKKYVIDGDQAYLYPINPKLSVEIYDQTLYIISGVILEVHQKLRLKK